MIGQTATPTPANLRAVAARSGGIAAYIGSRAILAYGSRRIWMTTSATASTTNGCQKRGFSATRVKTASGSNRTRPTSANAVISPPDRLRIVDCGLRILGFDVQFRNPKSAIHNAGRDPFPAAGVR